MPLPKGTDVLPLPELTEWRKELDQLINQRREEAAVQARKDFERVAGEIGMSLGQLMAGMRRKRARKDADDTSTEG